MGNFKEDIRSKVDQLVSENEDKKEILFIKEDFKSGFAQEISAEVELANMHEEEVEWLKETICASIIAFKDKEIDKYKKFKEEIVQYCKLTESYNLYTSYEALLQELYGKTLED